MNNDLLGIGEVADLVGLKRSTIYVMHSRGQLPVHDAVANQGRTKLWRRKTIVKWDRKRGRR